MDKKLIEEQCDNILKSCQTFAKFANDRTHEELDDYSFLVSIGSNLGKIKKELEIEIG